MFLEKLYPGRYGLTHIVLTKFLSIFHQMYILAFSFKDLKFFESMLVWFDAKRLFRMNWSIFIKSTYGLMYILFEKISSKFKSRYNTTWTKLSFESTFFYFKISLANTNHGQYRLTCIIHLGKFNQSLWKAY